MVLLFNLSRMRKDKTAIIIANLIPPLIKYRRTVPSFLFLVGVEWNLRCYGKECLELKDQKTHLVLFFMYAYSFFRWSCPLQSCQLPLSHYYPVHLLSDTTTTTYRLTTPRAMYPAQAILLGFRIPPRHLYLDVPKDIWNVQNRTHHFP